MSGFIQQVVVFVGQYATFSGLLGLPPNRFEVQDGRVKLVGPESEVRALARHLQLMYQGLPEGSPELAALQAEVAAASEAEPVPPSGEVRALLERILDDLPGEMRGQADTVVHNLRAKYATVFTDDDEVRVRQLLADEQQESNDGSSALQAGAVVTDGSADVPSDVLLNGGGTAEGSPDAGPGTAVAPAGDQGPGALGHGQESLVNGEPVANSTNQKLVRALGKLDPANHDHWTADGKPSVSAVERLYGSSDIRRKDIDAAVPGLTRTSARALGHPLN